MDEFPLYPRTPTPRPLDQQWLVSELNAAVVRERALTARLARAEKALALCKEYVAFLDRETEGPVRLAFNHGWRCPQEVVDKGVEYRARIAALTPDATTEGTDG